ncbi:hypothetical protein ACWD00_07230 [Streptomyces viridiviolaceus]
MLSTMQDGPLPLAELLRYAASVHADAAVTTRTGSAAHRRTFGELGARSAQLANALRGLGAGPSDRVATSKRCSPASAPCAT